MRVWAVRSVPGWTFADVDATSQRDLLLLWHSIESDDHS